MDRKFKHTRPVIATSMAAIATVSLSTLVATPAIAADWNSDRLWEPAAVNTESVGSLPDTGWLPDTAAANAQARFAPTAATVGSYPWSGTQNVELWDGTTAEVDVASGNLLLSVTDFESIAPGVAPRLTRYYNSLTDRVSPSLGNWTLGVGSDVGVLDGSAIFDGAASTFYGPNGYTIDYEFEAGAFQSIQPSGTNITPEAGQGGTVAALAWNQSGNRMEFTTEQATGWLASETDRNGVGTTYFYIGQSGESFEMIDAIGRVHTFTRVDADTARFAAADGRTWSYDFTGGLLTSAGIDMPGGHDDLGAFEYDADGRLTFISSPNSFHGSDLSYVRSLAVAYDGNGRVATLTQGTGATSATFVAHASSSFSYAAGSATIQNAIGNTTNYALDTTGRITAVTNPLGNTNATVWNAQNAVTSTSNAAQGSTGGANLATTDFDSLGNATSYSLPTGAGARAVYAQGVDCPNAGPGNAFLPHCIISSEGNTTEYTYDANGNRTGSTTSGVMQAWTYETDGSVCGGSTGQICSATDGKGNTTFYEYDGGNLITVSPPAPLSPTQYSYDVASRVTSVTAGGITTSYGYDMFDNVIHTRFNTGPDGEDSFSDIDATGVIHSAGWSQHGGVLRTERYAYDALARETSRVTELNGAQVSSSGATYDAVGNMTSYTTAAGVVTATYDVANQLIALAEPGSTCTGAAAGAAGCVRFTYDADGNETGRLFPGGAAQANTYDASSRLVGYSATDGTGAIVSGAEYSYTTATDADSALLQSEITLAGAGVTVPLRTTYTYDAHDRLTRAYEGQYSPSGGSVGLAYSSWSYTYDANGNTTRRFQLGQVGIALRNFTYNAANQVTSSTGDTTTWEYDALGQMTRNGQTGVETTYGTRNQVTSIGTTEYTSFGEGNTTTTADSADAFDISALGVMQRTQASASTSYLRTPQGALVGFDNTVSSYFYITDIRGSVVGIMNGTGGWEGGYRYMPYGADRFASSNMVVEANQYRYIGGEYEDGLYRFGARYYDPSLGAFTQMDPSGQEGNPYAYSQCDPVNRSDPSGLASSSDCARALFFGGAGLIGTIIATAFLPGGLAGLALGKATLVTLGYILGVTGTVYGVADALIACFGINGVG